MSMQNIEHVVLLMLENRSFDSMLGWLYEHDEPALNIPAAAADDRYRGLQSVNLDQFENTALNGSLSTKPTRGAQGFTIPDVDPGEEFAHVNKQFFNTETPATDAPITMLGVLADFVEILQKRGFNAADIERMSTMSMECFTPEQLPVLSQLAKHYAVSDDWFASVPSQTNPNRSFLMCATSNGMVNNGDLETNPQAREIESLLGIAIGDDRVDAPTIFNALSQADVDWTVFWQTSYLPRKITTLLDGLPDLVKILDGIGHQELAKLARDVLARLSPYTDYLKELTSGELESCYTWRLFPHIKDKIPNAAEHFQKLEEFHCRARSGKLPKFSYIEPFWSISNTTNDNSAFGKLTSAEGNDYHPPSNVLVGEEFVKAVYTSLIANRDAWSKTMLLITFDEFVGTFDHVTDSLKAGLVPPPWGEHGQPVYKSPTNFKFDRLGARVPTIMVSPYIQKGTVFRSEASIPYEHSSLIATLLEWVGQPGRVAEFGERAKAAPTFDKVATLAQARTDENELQFLDTQRNIGELIQYGDSLVLKNQNGEYLSVFDRTMKVIGGEAVIPDSLMSMSVDLDIAACFPTIGGDQAVLAFVTQSPDPGKQINNHSMLMIVSRETGLGPRNLLGAWNDSHDCYYYDEYIHGDNAAKEQWLVQKLDDASHALHYGDKIYLENSKFTGQRLTRDKRLLVGSGWITTQSGGDYWTIEPPAATARSAS